MLNRRDFIRDTAMGFGVAIGLPALRPGTLGLNGHDATRLTRIGIQLYTLRNEMKKSVDSTLARVASIGYSEVEFAGYFDKTPAQIAAALKATGLRAPSAHITLDQIRSGWAETLDAASQIGHDYLVCAYIDAKERTLDSYNRIADEFNRGAEQARKHQIQFAYHNHDFEFIQVSGVEPYEVLLKKCDPGLVQLELDLYWVNKAGRDPLAYFSAHPGRFPLVHVKDMTASGAMADVGSGRLPFASYFAQARKAGIKHYFVERDDPRDAFASADASFKHLKSLEF